MSDAADLQTLAVLRALQRVEVTARVCGALDDVGYHLQLTRQALLDELGLDGQSAFHLRRALDMMASEYGRLPVLSEMIASAAEEMRKLSALLR